MSTGASRDMVGLTDPFDARTALQATGLLATFNQATVLTSADVHVAGALGRLGGEPDERVVLAAAMAVRAVRLGSVCLDLPTVHRTATTEAEEPVDLEGLPWPDPDAWLSACRASPLVATGSATAGSGRPLRLVESLLYLDRYWQQEESVRADLDARTERPLPPMEPARLAAGLAHWFPGPPPDHQRLAAAACATGWLTVVAGGPGTGKTTLVARLLGLLDEVLPSPPRVALAAPTGKAAARLTQAVTESTDALVGEGLPARPPPAASTLHRLLGWRPGTRSRFRHDRSRRLPYDVVVVDETSMVSLTLMARLLEAVRPDARLVLMGDPDQLASVDAGAVLGDLVARPPRAGPDARSAVLSELVDPDLEPADETRVELRNDVVRLRRTYRFGGEVDQLAAAIRSGRPDDVVAVLRAGGRTAGSATEFVETEPGADDLPDLPSLRADMMATGRAMHEAAAAGDGAAALAALDRHRLLCGPRRGPFGVLTWSDRVERWLTAGIDRYGAGGEWYLGRPLLATTNDYELKLFNGDTGVVVAGPDGSPVAVFGRGGAETVRVAPSRLGTVQTVHAMTVHRGQGSQFQRVTVLLPPAESPLLTRELLYTAATRASAFVRIVGSEEAVRAAVSRPVVRASGLRRPRPAPDPKA